MPRAETATAFDDHRVATLSDKRFVQDLDVIDAGSSVEGTGYFPMTATL
ncbi:MAG: hypothetical protein IPK16_30725 [Anaerolineales bacterium]|nr:hypothetical protein [Anaerolineales bacterium]